MEEVIVYKWSVVYLDGSGMEERDVFVSRAEAEARADWLAARGRASTLVAL